MDNNKRKNLDSYFLSSAKKNKKINSEQSISTNDESSETSNRVDDESAEMSPTTSSENVNIKEQRNVQDEENNIKTKVDIIDLSHSCQDSPAQPKLNLYPKNHENRSFLAKWYHGRPWLEYSIARDSAYCYYCRHFGAPTSSSNKKPQTDAFINNGLCSIAAFSYPYKFGS